MTGSGLTAFADLSIHRYITDKSATSIYRVNFGIERTFLHARMCLYMYIRYKVVEDMITALEELLQLTPEQHRVRGIDPCSVENLV